jgi:hypothetical protein
MAQTSITLLSQTRSLESVKTGSVIGFNASDRRITSSNTATVNLAVFKKFDILTISGATNASNNKTYTVKTDGSTSFVEVQESMIDESAGATVSITHSGFVSDKEKGDGYYSQVDGVHTVAYHVSPDINDTAGISIKMQGSLATIPTEDDWFDINGTAITNTDIDGSTLVFPKNFTGNFVWVRAKCTGMTAGSVTKILYNH